MKFQKFYNKLIYIFEKFQKLILAIFLILFFLLAALTIYLNKSGNKSIATLNTQQKSIGRLIGKWNNLKSQQKNVELMLEKNKNFKLGFYINNLIKEKNLNAKTASPAVQPLGKTFYEEVSQVLTVSNSNTQVLVELLDLIESNNLVYIKKLEITPQLKTISFAITLATLQQKVTSNENK